MSVTHFEGERTRTEANLTCFADEHRREIIAVLREQEAPVDRRDLAKEMAASEEDVSPVTVSEQAVDRVELALHHNHLPKLEDAGYLRYDVQRNQITPKFASETFEGALPEL